MPDLSTTRSVSCHRRIARRLRNLSNALASILPETFGHFLDNAYEHEQMVETAFVYHDIGLWTDEELAYLEPSEAVALQDNDKYGWGLDPDALRGAIHWHHKVFKYNGIHADVIEACRKADWIDATQGWCRKGMPRSAIAKVESTFPNCGFHKTLLRLAKEYGGSTLVGGFKVMRGIVKW